MNLFRTLRRAALTLLLVGSAGTSGAVDGVLEISRAGALAGGITVGDTPGYPVTIAASGSYRLTSNLVQADPDLDVIEVTADEVTIDMNGFTISGRNDCTPSFTGVYLTSVSCAFPGTGAGIEASSTDGLAVHSGVIAKIGGVGVSGGTRVRLSDLSVSQTGSTGVVLGTLGQATHVHVELARSSGFFLQGNYVVESCTSITNDDHGFVLDREGIIRDSVADRNGARGIEGSFREHIVNFTATFNGGAGIDTSGFSRVEGSLLSHNQGPGLQHGGLDSMYISGNVIVSNGSTVVGSVVELGTNICNGNTTCP